jgi:hypothetical protein
MSRDESVEPVCQTLASEFPGVPARIIAAVLAAYGRLTPSLDDAAQRTRARLRDACAL